MVDNKSDPKQPDAATAASHDSPVEKTSTDKGEPPVEIGGREGPDPTRYGDWEKNGRCIDF